METTTTLTERYLTVEEVADRLRVNREAVRRWLRAGELRGVHLSRKTGWRITEADLAAFLRVRENRLQNGRIDDAER